MHYRSINFRAKQIVCGLTVIVNKLNPQVTGQTRSHKVDVGIVCCAIDLNHFIPFRMGVISNSNDKLLHRLIFSKFQRGVCV